MSQEKKYVSLSKLSTFLDNLYSKFASSSHKHTLSDITNYTVDYQLSSTSTNPVQNKVIDAEFEAISAAMNALEDAIDGKSNSDHNHDGRYYTETEIDTKLTSKSDTTHKHDSLYDTKGAAATVQQNLNAVAAAKADVEHDHAISDITNLQSALDGKAASSHGTHVTYSTATPAMNGTAAVGTAANVSRGDHVHPTDTSRASKVEFDTHTVDTTKHITSTERTNWNAAHTHSQSTHARVDATKVADSTTNGNILVNDSEVNVYSHPNSGATAGTYRSVTVNAQGHVTAGSNPTTLSGYGITDAETKTDASAKLAEAKTYADNAATKVKNDLLNGAGTAYDTLKELGDLIDDNVDAIDALEKVAATKANASDLTSHTSNKSNPHGVTLSQLGVTATAAELNIMDGVTATAAEINVLDGITTTTAELNYVDGVTSNIQTQLNAKQASITGAATTITGSNLTASRALVSDGNGKVAVSAVTSTELGYLDGVTSAIQTQLDGKAASSHGTHVTYSTTAPVMDGTASVGTATTVARSDHKHPVDTSRAAQSDLTSHTGNKSNPHAVTKAQVGLGNVDNTSDMDKPVSTAQQREINYQTSLCAPLGLVVADDNSISDYSALEDFILNHAAVMVPDGSTIVNLVVTLTEAFEPFNKTGTLFLTIDKVDDACQDLIINGILHSEGSMPTQYVCSRSNGEWMPWDLAGNAKLDQHAADSTWTKIYDSGAINSKVNSIMGIDITGYKKLKLAIKCVNTTSSEGTSAVEVAFMGDGYIYYYFTNLFPSLIMSSTSTTSAMAEFTMADGFVFCDNVLKSTSAPNMFSNGEGLGVWNMTSLGGGIMTCNSPFFYMDVSAANDSTSHYFGVGSRVIVWGCKE